ncbi:MAG: ABC transporter permease [Deinococcales bacterium]
MTPNKRLVKLAFVNLLRHPWRSLAILLGIALAVASVLATLSIGSNVEASVAASLKEASGKADLLILPGSSGRAIFNLAEVTEALKDVAGVETALPVLEYMAEPLRDLGEVGSSITGIRSGFILYGRDLDNINIPLSLLEGQLPQKGDYGIALSEHLTKAWGLNLGDKLSFASAIGPLDFHLSAIIESNLGLSNINNGRIAITELADLQDRVKLAGRVSYVEIIRQAGVNSEALAKSLESRLGDEYSVTPPAGAATFVTGISETLEAGLRVLSAILVALSSLMVYNSFTTATLERSREYALLRTICLTKRQILWVALVEAALLALTAGLLGITLGFILANVITKFNALLLGFAISQVELPLSNSFLALTIGILTTLTAAILPALNAAQTTPMLANRQSQMNQLALSEAKFTTIIGLPLLLLGIILSLSVQNTWSPPLVITNTLLSTACFFGSFTLLAPWFFRLSLYVFKPLLTRFFGQAGKVGVGFSLRHSLRNGVAFSSVVIGVSLVIAIGAFVAGIREDIKNWLQITVAGDLFVRSAVSFPEGFREMLAEDGMIETVSPVAIRAARLKPSEGRDRTVVMVLVEPERFHPTKGFGKFLFVKGQGDQQVAYEALVRGEVLAARALHERFQINQNDPVTLRTRSGWQDIKVGAVIVDFSAGGEAFVGNINQLEAFGGGSYDIFVLKTRQNPDMVKARLLERFPQYHLDIESAVSYRDEILNLSQRVFGTMNALLYIAIIIAALSVANTLGMNLSSRQREIAVLRLLGFERRDVMKLISAEALVIVILGSVVGIFCGMVLAKSITTCANVLTGYEVTPYLPWSLILIALISSPLVGLLTSLMPARRAAKLAPVLALRQ